jgi:hypothetical protein
MQRALKELKIKTSNEKVFLEKTILQSDEVLVHLKTMNVDTSYNVLKKIQNFINGSISLPNTCASINT